MSTCVNTTQPSPTLIFSNYLSQTSVRCIWLKKESFLLSDVSLAARYELSGWMNSRHGSRAYLLYKLLDQCTTRSLQPTYMQGIICIHKCRPTKSNSFICKYSIFNCEQIKLANCSSAMLQLVNSMHRKPRVQSPSIGIIMQRTLPINQNRFRFQLSLESESAPGLNHFPLIIFMLVCKINVFFKSDKHKSVVYLLSYFYVKNLV